MRNIWNIDVAAGGMVPGLRIAVRKFLLKPKTHSYSH